MNDGRAWWTDERVDELKARWTKGETGTQIRIAMGAASRSAVVGKVHRLKLEARAKPNGQRHDNGQVNRNALRRKRANGQAPKIMQHIDGLVFIARGKTVVVEQPPEDFKNPKPFIELENCDCHWPGAGEVGPELLFCAAPVINGHSYCLRHCRIAYQRSAFVPKAPQR